MPEITDPHDVTSASWSYKPEGTHVSCDVVWRLSPCVTGDDDEDTWSLASQITWRVERDEGDERAPVIHQGTELRMPGALNRRDLVALRSIVDAALDVRAEVPDDRLDEMVTVTMPRRRWMTVANQVRHGMRDRETQAHSTTSRGAVRNRHAVMARLLNAIHHDLWDAIEGRA